MKHLLFRKPNQPVSEVMVAQFEKKLGVPLPHDYRSFLLTTNGGYLDKENSFFLFEDARAEAVFGDDGFIVEQIYPLQDEARPRDELWNEICCFRGRIPEHTIPIAANICGDLILLGIRGPTNNVVYAWDHDHEGLAGTKRSFKNVYKLSQTFAGFVDKLTAFRPVC